MDHSFKDQNIRKGPWTGQGPKQPRKWGSAYKAAQNCRLAARPASLVLFSSVTQSCPTLGYPMDCIMPGFPVHHQLPEFTQTHVHWEKAMATHSSTLAWKIPWTEEPGRLQSMSVMTEGHHFHFSLSCIGEGNGNPLRVLAWRIPGTGEPGGLPSMGLHRVGHD